jgi:hypothetical protein
MPRRYSKRHTRRHKKRSNSKMMGGNCPGSAANFGALVSSTGGEQVSQGSLNGTSDNAIAFSDYKGGSNNNDLSKMGLGNGEPPAFPLNGGKRYKKKRGGSGIFTDLAVPAVLLVANQAMKRKNSTFKKKSSSRRR